MAIFRALALILLLLTAACGDDEPTRKVDLSHREPLPQPVMTADLTYAYLPQYSHTVSFRRHNPLVRYLSEAVGLRIRQVFPDTFDEHMKMVGRGEIDISFTNPFAYVKMAKDYGTLAFARSVEMSGRAAFRGQIITRADNAAIRNIDDCVGARWIAVDPSSAGGFLFPLGLFLDNGFTLDDFAAVDFAPGPGGKQEGVVLAVYAGNYDIGSIREGTLDLLADKIDLDQIRVVAQTPWYPGWVYSARAGLDPALVARIQEAMLALSPNTPAQAAILEQAGFAMIIPSEDDDFDVVRELVDKVAAAEGVIID